ncbi:MAG: PLP-dependent aminotransferase family protein [Hyphomicrobiales bacterium]
MTSPHLPSKAQERPKFAHWLSTGNDVTATFLAASRIPGLINLGGGLPEADTYPVEHIAEITKRVVLAHPTETLGYGPIDGLPDLRDLLAERFSTDTLKLTRENVLITSGGMQGLHLVGQVLLEQGALVAAQSPTYLGALDAWRPSNPTYRPFFVEGNKFEAHDALNGAQFAYAVPNFSNPSGYLVSLAQRQELVQAALKTGTWLVEDDPYGALYYDDAPLPNMLNLAAEAAPGAPYTGPVIYLGTMSKQIAPGLRIGWAIASPEMISALTTAKQGSDMCSSGLTQRVTLETFKTGLVEEIYPKIIDTYRPRRNALCDALDQYLTPWFDWKKPVGGMFVWAQAKDPHMNTDELLAKGLENKVCISPSSVFDPEGKNHRCVRLNFTFNPPDKLAEGVRRLAQTLEEMDKE